MIFRSGEEGRCIGHGKSERHAISELFGFLSFAESADLEGFQGVMMTEYEGHCFYLNDAVEQIGRHLQMQRNILGRLGR